MSDLIPLIPPPRPQWFLGAIGVTLGLVAAGLLVFLLVTRQEQPADLLPADRTVALFSTMDRAQLAPYAAWYPLLTSLPSVSGQFSVAILRGNDGTPFWILFRRPDNAFPWSSLIVRSSIPHPEQYLKSRRSLSSLSAFAVLRSQTRQFSSWAFVDARSLLPVGSSDPVTSFLTNNPYALITEHDDVRSITLFAQRTSLAGTIAPTVPVGSGDVFVLRVPDGEGLWQDVVSHLPPDRQAIVESTLLTWVRQHVGPSVSVQYDLLPLLREASSLSIHHGDEGSSILVAGSVSDADDATRLSRILASAKSLFPAMSVERRDFDENFSATILRSATDESRDSTQTIDGWTVETIAAADGKHGVVIARNGNRFLLGTDPNRIVDIVRNSAVLTLPHLNSEEPQTLRAGGLLTQSMAGSSSELIPFSSVLVPLLAGTNLWSLEDGGTTLTLNVQALRR